MFAAVNTCLRRQAQHQPHRLQHVLPVWRQPNLIATAISSRPITSHSRATTKNKSAATPTSKFKKPWTAKPTAGGKFATTSSRPANGKPKRGVRPAGSNFKRFPLFAKSGLSTRGGKSVPAPTKKEFYANKKAAAAKAGMKIATPTITSRGHGQQEALKPLQMTTPQPKKSAKTFQKRERAWPTAVSQKPRVVQHAYYIPRTSNGHLPVYSDVRNAGGRYLIMINNVEGDVQRLANDLSGTLFQNPERSSRFRIDAVKEKKLIVRGGYWKEPIMEWLSNKGF